MADSARASVLIAGCGDLGTEAGLLFRSLGHPVTGVRRRGALLPASFERQSVDLRTDRPIVPDGLAAVVVALTASARTAEAYRETYVAGLSQVLAAVSESGQSPRLILVSSTAVYGVDDGSWVDERTPTRATSPTSGVLLEAERVAASAPLDSCLLRLSGIYGPGRERLIEQVRSGEARLSAAPLFTNRMHRDDAARAIVHLALRAEKPPSTVIGVDDEPAERNTVLRFIADELGLPAPVRDDRETPRAGNRRMSNALLRSTGFRCTYPTYREGYSAVLAGGQIRHP